jgi:hypothetical protein
MAVSISRKYYFNQTSNNNIPFLSVSHDGWDSQHNDILGVSLHLILPCIWTQASMSIGLNDMRMEKVQK